MVRDRLPVPGHRPQMEDPQARFYETPPPPLPGRTLERVNWTINRVYELFHSGKSLDEVKKIIKEEEKKEPWKCP